MGSNIYYTKRELIKKSADMWVEFDGALCLNRQKRWVSDIITSEKIDNIFSNSSFLGILLYRANIHLNRFELRSQELWFEDNNKGKIFIPRNIHISNDIDMKDYYIVLIDDEFEIVYWPGARLSFDDPNKMKSYLVTELELLSEIEKSFQVLYDYVNGNKVDGYCEDVEGLKINYEDVVKLISAIHSGFDDQSHKNKLDNIYQAAIDPLGFYEENKNWLRLKGYDFPDSYLFRNMLIDFLLDERKIVNVDWKITVSDINYAIEILSNGLYEELLCESDFEENDEDDYDPIENAEDKLLMLDKSLLCIDGGSDEYLFILVDSAQSHNVVETAKTC